MIIKWSRGNAPNHVAQNYKLSEFECKCGVCDGQMIDSDLLAKLDALHDTIKGAIIIHSGYRCDAHNTAIGGETKSRHLRGLAADIFTNTCTLEQLEKLCEKLFQRMGVAKTFLHVDVDVGSAHWTYP
jgi:uncharacterized protein YcbK (DUF882 family)